MSGRKNTFLFIFFGMNQILIKIDKFKTMPLILRGIVALSDSIYTGRNVGHDNKRDL